MLSCFRFGPQENAGLHNKMARDNEERDALNNVDERLNLMKHFELQDELQALQLSTTSIEHEHDFSSEDPEHLLEGR